MSTKTKTTIEPATPARLLERFLSYVKVDTQSKAGAATTPSTPGQWVLLRQLQKEMGALGLKDIHLSPQGHLMGTVPTRTPKKFVPTIAFLAHVDTAPDFSGTNVKPLVHRKWNGKPIRLPDDPTKVLDRRTDPHLQSAVGKDLITASGKTLLGSDDKAGVAIIMHLAHLLMADRSLAHGPIRLCFLPDEEVGLCGAASVDLKRLGADFGYTLDGGGMGEVVGESFSGDSAIVTIEGVATHPGTARMHRMVNAVHLAGKLIAALPREYVSPETSEDHQGYLHPVRIQGNAAQVTLEFILRDFDEAGLRDKRNRVAGLCRGIQATEPRARIRVEFSPNYRNMALALKKDPRPVNLAKEATKAAGLTPTSPPIRGGTDGSCLSGRGLPTPNLSSGQHNVHGPLEWITLQDMELCAQVCRNLVALWAK